MCRIVGLKWACGCIWSGFESCETAKSTNVPGEVCKFTSAEDVGRRWRNHPVDRSHSLNWCCSPHCCQNALDLIVRTLKQEIVATINSDVANATKTAFTNRCCRSYEDAIRSHLTTCYPKFCSGYIKLDSMSRDLPRPAPQRPLFLTFQEDYRNVTGRTDTRILQRYQTVIDMSTGLPRGQCIPTPIQQFKRIIAALNGLCDQKLSSPKAGGAAIHLPHFNQHTFDGRREILDADPPIEDDADPSAPQSGTMMTDISQSSSTAAPSSSMAPPTAHRRNKTFRRKSSPRQPYPVCGSGWKLRRPSRAMPEPFSPAIWFRRESINSDQRIRQRSDTCSSQHLINSRVSPSAPVTFGALYLSSSSPYRSNYATQRPSESTRGNSAISSITFSDVQLTRPFVYPIATSITRTNRATTCPVSADPMTGSPRPASCGRMTPMSCTRHRTTNWPFFTALKLIPTAKGNPVTDPILRDAVQRYIEDKWENDHKPPTQIVTIMNFARRYSLTLEELLQALTIDGYQFSSNEIKQHLRDQKLLLD